MNLFGEQDRTHSIVYYLLKALRMIPYYWGFTTRCVDMDEMSLKMYQPGHIVTWLQFSSSAMGDAPLS